jgi:hypothetical protein
MWGENRNACRSLVGNPKRIRPLGSYRCRLSHYILSPQGNLSLDNLLLCLLYNVHARRIAFSFLSPQATG